MPKRTPRRAAAPAFSNTVPAPAAATGSALSNVSQASAQAFTFGDPVPVLDGREILDYCEAWLNGKWYEPPISLGRPGAVVSGGHAPRERAVFQAQRAGVHLRARTGF